MGQLGGIGFCQRSADATASTANQPVYAPASSGTSIFSAETGSSNGTLSDSAPAAFTSNTAYFQGSAARPLSQRPAYVFSHWQPK